MSMVTSILQQWLILFKYLSELMDFNVFVLQLTVVSIMIGPHIVPYWTSESLFRLTP